MNYEKTTYPFIEENPADIPLWTVKIPLDMSKLDKREREIWSEGYIPVSSNQTISTKMGGLEIAGQIGAGKPTAVPTEKHQECIKIAEEIFRKEIVGEPKVFKKTFKKPS